MTQIIHAITILASQWTLFIVEYQCKPRQFLIVPGEVLHGFKSHRISHCLFCLVPVTSTFVSNTNLHLVPSFTRSIFAITSGCMLQEVAFSRACHVHRPGGSAQFKISASVISQFGEVAQPNLPFCHLDPPP